MTTPYIDPNIVFASDAPTQDKPPAFNNYAKGMGETRSNEGRPTIKQFNFIQQQNDFKFLYIHERGACLPFVDGFPYENNAIVFKDGFIQQKNGASWIIPFMRGSQNLAELTDVAQARTKLNVYSKSESLAKASNLSDLANKATARTNLGVYSKAETNSIAGTPNATETIAGKAKIATTVIAQEGTNDTDIITPAKLKGYLDNKVLGINQTWQNVTTSRSSETIYTNSSTAPIMLSIAVRDGGGGVRLYVNGFIAIRLEDLSGGLAGYTQIVAIVPAGETYELYASKNPITFWGELK